MFLPEASREEGKSLGIFYSPAPRRHPDPGKDGSRQIPVRHSRCKIPVVSPRWARLHSVNSGEFNGAHASPENFSTCNPGGGIGCCVRARGTSPCMIRDGERNVQEHCASRRGLTHTTGLGHRFATEDRWDNLLLLLLCPFTAPHFITESIRIT